MVLKSPVCQPKRRTQIPAASGVRVEWLAPDGGRAYAQPRFIGMLRNTAQGGF